MIVHLFFSYGKNYPFFLQLAPLHPACTQCGGDEGGLCYYIDYFGDIVATIHLGAGPKSRPLPLISYHYYDNLRYHI